MTKKTSWWQYGVMLFALLGILTACNKPAKKAHCFEHNVGYVDLDYALCTDKSTYNYGEPVQVSFTLMNRGNEAITLDGGTKPAVDLQQSAEYWSDTHPTEAATQITLLPGDTHSLTWYWIPQQAYLEKLFQQEMPHSMPVTFLGITYYDPEEEPDSTWLDAKYLPPPHEVVKVSPEYQLAGHCVGEQRAARDLELQICTDKREYQFGELVQIQWQIRNISDSLIVLDGGDAAAMDVYVVEWSPPATEGGTPYYAEERWSNTHSFEKKLELAPGEIHCIEWQWPTTQTNLDAVLEYQRLPGEDRSLVRIYGDYAFQPQNRWSFLEEVIYTLEDNQ